MTGRVPGPKMLKKGKRLKRVTVNSFVTIFVLILITPLTIVVVVIWSIFDPSGNGPHLMARAWAKVMLWTSLVRVQVIGAENLDPSASYVFVANHTSAYDILVLLAYLPFQFRWLAKEELFKIPFFGWAMARVGYIPINRSNPRASARSLIKAAKKIKAGASVVIFPEGTRSRDGLVHEFKKGGFTLAVRSGRPLAPVSISGTHRILPTKTLQLRSGRVRIVLGRPLPTVGLDRADQVEVMNNIREEIIFHHQPEYGRPGPAGGGNHD